MSLPSPTNAAPADDARAFRDTLARFATGVALVTAAPEGEPFGLIVNTLTSVSLEPPLILFCPSRSSLTWSRIRLAGRFGVNVLGQQHEPFVTRTTLAGPNRFAGVDWKRGDGGAPLLTDALATLECEIVAEHPAGDHWIVVGRVDSLGLSASKDPLVFFASEYRALRQGDDERDRSFWLSGPRDSHCGRDGRDRRAISSHPPRVEGDAEPSLRSSMGRSDGAR
jgi:3-hydroxy-9,10-secoandrosta-1,3,5(10)-triene-9,17-dione monooxygenase reductase component